MTSRRFILAYVGVSGTGNVAEFGSQESLDIFKSECDEYRQITAAELRSAEFASDVYEYISDEVVIV